MMSKKKKRYVNDCTALLQHPDMFPLVLGTKWLDGCNTELDHSISLLGYNLVCDQVNAR